MHSPLGTRRLSSLYPRVLIRLVKFGDGLVEAVELMLPLF